MVDSPTPGQAEELRRLMQRLFRRFGMMAGDTTPCGKPLPIAHAHALMVLLVQGAISQQDLGRELCIDKSNVTRLCARLVESGHLTQQPSEDDGRVRLLRLTPKGRRLALQVQAASTARFAALLQGLDPRVRPKVLQTLSHLIAAVESLPVSKPRKGKDSV